MMHAVSKPCNQHFVFPVYCTSPKTKSKTKTSKTKSKITKNRIGLIKNKSSVVTFYWLHAACFNSTPSSKTKSLHHNTVTNASLLGYCQY